MLDKDARFTHQGGIWEPGDRPFWYVGDFDRRQTFSVLFSATFATIEDDYESGDLAQDYLGRHVDSLGPEVHAIEVTPDGELVSVSSKPEDDTADYLRYPTLRYLQRGSTQGPNTKKSITRKPRIQKFRMRTIRRSELCELDRLAPAVDLVSYRGQKVVFKYCFWPTELERFWVDINIWARLPPHPNIVPFHRVVVEELDGREHVVGFTSRYIAGGTLEDSVGRVFKLKWLKQLMRLVDDLNFKFGIQHQDIAPRNLVVNHATDMIMLFDFNVSRRLSVPAGESPADEHRNDVKFVVFTLYELITRDHKYPIQKLYFADMNAVLDVDWVKHPDVRLDKPVASYRAVLDAWLLRRKERANEIITGASKYNFNWPRVPMITEIHEHEAKSSGIGADGSTVEPEPYPCWLVRGCEAKAENIQLARWERPAQKKISEGMRILADGTVIDRIKRRKIHEDES